MRLTDTSNRWPPLCPSSSSQLFREQILCQLPLPQRLKMVEKYYDLDDAGKDHWERRLAL